jgi:uncharacterized protein (DUF1501 family)
MLTRRFFVKGSALVMAGAGAVPSWLGRAAAATQGKKKTLVAIFQRGAADGLSIVAPFGDKHYAELRPTIGVMPGMNTGQQRMITNGIDLDGFFALHPQMDPLKPFWEKQQLAIVEATGSPDPSRSHFDAQDFMESGTPGERGNGWLNRALTPPSADSSPLRAVSMGSQLPRTLWGDRSAIAVADLQQYKMNDQTASIVESMYESSPDKPMATAGKDAFAAMKIIQSLGNSAPDNRAQYGPAGPFGRNLQDMAKLIKADAGVEAAFVEIGGWDHHQNEQQQMPQLLRQFSSALAAFCQDMGDRMEDIVLVTMSEFGRTAQENGDNGTDHGHGSVMMVLGGSVAGGKVYGRWPGLAKEQLFEGRDLDVTTDFRAVLSELVTGHLGQKDIAQVFPGYKPGEKLGLLRS